MQEVVALSAQMSLWMLHPRRCISISRQRRDGVLHGQLVIDVGEPLLDLMSVLVAVDVVVAIGGGMTLGMFIVVPIYVIFRQS